MKKYKYSDFVELNISILSLLYFYFTVGRGDFDNTS